MFSLNSTLKLRKSTPNLHWFLIPHYSIIHHYSRTTQVNNITPFSPSIGLIQLNHKLLWVPFKDDCIQKLTSILEKMFCEEYKLLSKEVIIICMCWYATVVFPPGSLPWCCDKIQNCPKLDALRWNPEGNFL